MISRENLVKVLREAKFEEARIERILKKSIKLLLDIGREEKIRDILEVLAEHDISKDSIEGCLNILAKGNPKNIEDVLKTLENHGISKDDVESNLLVLVTGKSEEITDIM